MIISPTRGDPWVQQSRTQNMPVRRLGALTCEGAYITLSTRSWVQCIWFSDFSNLVSRHARSQVRVGHAGNHSRTQSPSYARSTERDEGLWPFSYPEPFLRAVNRARRGALAKSISNWLLIGHNEIHGLL